MRSCCILLRPAARRAPGILTVNLAGRDYHMGRLPACFRRKLRNGVAE